MRFDLSHMFGRLITGSKYSTSFKTYLTMNGKIISPWHDISYQTERKNVIRVFNEIPRFENAKFEMSKAEKFNPITQDIKKGVPRFVGNVFPYKGYIWNYGAIPQTFESPKVIDKSTNAFGDNDPIDVIEIGSKLRNTGEVYEARVLGALAMLDDGECDWKILCIGVDNEEAVDIHNLEDVEGYMPGLLKGTIDWFTYYKSPDNRTVDFALDSKFQNADFAMDIIQEAHDQWIALFSGNAPRNVSLLNSTLKESAFYEPDGFEPKIEHEDDTKQPSIVNSFHFTVKKE